MKHIITVVQTVNPLHKVYHICKENAFEIHFKGACSGSDAKQGERLGLGNEQVCRFCKGKCEEMEIKKGTVGPLRKICC